MSDARDRATQIVSRWGDTEAGSQQAAEELLPLVYDELRRLARGYLARERRDHTLQPTALVHEAYMRLVDQTRVNWRGRAHFLGVGAQIMRRLLVDHARGHGRRKRGGSQQRVTLDEEAVIYARQELDLSEIVTLDRALAKLERLDPRQARVVELRFFAGLTSREIAEVLGISVRTIKGDWAHARLWLKREVSRGEEGGGPDAGGSR